MMRRFLLWFTAGVAGLALAASAGPASAVQLQARAAADLAELSLEELMSIEVYSVAKKKQKLADSAAAVYVVTQEEIRRSGVTSIPEALRLVPGVEVARIDSNKWAITIRGFNERFANKLLVLIDGRSVYTPLFAGVYWDTQDTVLEDIDRIEVVRGPGGTLWGANAVNGVINILTKSAKDTQGLLVSGGAGTEEEGFGTVRYGAELAPDFHARVYGKYFARDDFDPTLPRLEGDDAADQWRLSRGGFRMDWDPQEGDSIMLQGEMFDGDASSFSLSPAPPPTFVESTAHNQELFGAHLLGRWTHLMDGGSEMRLQAYYDRTDRDAKPPTTNENRNTADVDFQHRIRLGQHHDVVWGLGYRLTWDDMGGSFTLQFSPRARSVHLFSGFLQDEVALLDDKLRLTLGIKLEHNSYTGLEVQPNARALWKVRERHTLWGAISRAVRTPNRAEDDIRINSAVLPAGTPGTPCEASPIPCIIALLGGSSFDAEELLAFELGYRAQLRENLGLDVTAFYNLYDDLRTVVADPAATFPETDPPPPHVVIPVKVGNELEADAWGVEIAADWRPIGALTLRSGYTFFEMDLDFKGAAKCRDPFTPCDTISGLADGSSPQNQVFLRSMLDLPHNFELDTNVKWVGKLDALDIEDYASLDLRLGWRPSEEVEFSLVGQNLLYASNQEFASSQFVSDEPTKIERGVYGKVTLRF